MAKRMGIGRNKIYRWKDKGEIPKKYLLQASEETERPLPWLPGQEVSENRSNVENALRKLDNMIAEGNYNLAPEKNIRLSLFSLRRSSIRVKSEKKKFKT